MRNRREDGARSQNRREATMATPTRKMDAIDIVLATSRRGSAFVWCWCHPWVVVVGGMPRAAPPIYALTFMFSCLSPTVTPRPAARAYRFCQYCSQSGKYFILVCSRTGPVPEKAEAIVVDVVTVLYLLTGGRAGLCWVPELSRRCKKRVVVDFRRV